MGHLAAQSSKASKESQLGKESGEDWSVEGAKEKDGEWKGRVSAGGLWEVETELECNYFSTQTRKLKCGSEMGYPECRFLRWDW